MSVLFFADLIFDELDKLFDERCQIKAEFPEPTEVYLLIMKTAEMNAKQAGKDLLDCENLFHAILEQDKKLQEQFEIQQRILKHEAKLKIGKMFLQITGLNLGF